ncbi:MAG: class I SAM-dependent methyltransferase [Candidatus Obscuribacterales bacterium]|jgi:SAM-dependent methyltransferase
MNSTERFSGLADIYAASRPSYPVEAIDFIVQACGLTKQSLVVDVGCGTGISTRLFEQRGFAVVGIEPNEDMRSAAIRDSIRVVGESDANASKYCSGTAENTGLANECADLVLCAQAFHWFDANKALAEFQRILKPGGHVVLMWNERNEVDDLTRGYGDLFRQIPETAKVEMRRGIAGEPLLQSMLFSNAARTNFAFSQRVDLSGLLGRAFSASYAPKEGASAEALRAGLTALFEQSQVDGFADLQYETSVFIAERKV